MKTITFHLQKGGVGKTTIAGLVAHELSNKNKKTLLIDADPQSNITSWFLSKVTFEVMFELAEVLQGEIDIRNSLLYYKNMCYIPSFGLDGELRLYGESKLSDEPYVVCDLIEEIKELQMFDYVIFDLSPAIGRLEKSVLMACDEVITPLTPEYFSLDGLEIFASELARLKRNFKKAPEHNMIILNAFDERIKQHQFIKNQIKCLSFEKIIFPVDPAYRKAQAENTMPQNFNLKQSSLDSLKQLTDYIIKMG